MIRLNSAFRADMEWWEWGLYHEGCVAAFPSLRDMVRCIRGMGLRSGLGGPVVSGTVE